MDFIFKNIEKVIQNLLNIEKIYSDLIKLKGYYMKILTHLASKSKISVSLNILKESGSQFIELAKITDEFNVSIENYKKIKLESLRFNEASTLITSSDIINQKNKFTNIIDFDNKLRNSLSVAYNYTDIFVNRVMEINHSINTLSKLINVINSSITIEMKRTIFSDQLSVEHLDDFLRMQLENLNKQNTSITVKDFKLNHQSVNTDEHINHDKQIYIKSDQNNLILSNASVLDKSYADKVDLAKHEDKAMPINEALYSKTDNNKIDFVKYMEDYNKLLPAKSPTWVINYNSNNGVSSGDNKITPNLNQTIVNKINTIMPEDSNKVNNTNDDLILLTQKHSDYTIHNNTNNLSNLAEPKALETTAIQASSKNITPTDTNIKLDHQLSNDELDEDIFLQKKVKQKIENKEILANAMNFLTELKSEENNNNAVNGPENASITDSLEIHLNELNQNFSQIKNEIISNLF
jgi:hypothetical protein